MYKAVFLDRDGTINVEKNYLYRSEDFTFIDGVPQAIRRLNDAGYLVVVVTNQSGVARGYFTREDVDLLHRHLQRELELDGATIDAFYLCPHHPLEGVGELKIDCECRKGKPGMLLQAAAELKIDLKQSYMIGDKLADIEAGGSAGCASILVLTGYGAGETDRALAAGALAVVDDLPKAVDYILQYSNPADCRC
ncbi:D-glycero-beta-D-manno-heptose 1,7-bisphosphate 7-phosphatase [Trichloromonas sp.]|uniref:D-glycero-beta-D-manno-heptose 1,7-bisphosphate 7-phosphatase n=1 Tax=Trichloromonas sp. TaxID=3069249 RepID=UPI003D81A64D